MNENEKTSLSSFDLPENKLPNDFERIGENKRGEPLTWGATPLVTSNDVTIQQNAVKRELELLFDQENIPSFVTPSLADYIYVLNMSRTANRESRNQDSFAYREKTDLDGFPLEGLSILNRALSGHASPAELLCIQKPLGVPSIELASLTHPYAQRIELLKEMRHAVYHATILLGGEIVRSIVPIYEVKGCDNPHNPELMQGVHMTRKTMLGRLEDGTEIIERSSFVVMVDQLPADRANAIRTLPFENNENWSTQANSACNLSKLAPLFLDNDEYEKAIPVSTTIVAINSELERRLLSEEAMRKRQRHYLAVHASKI